MERDEITVDKFRSLLDADDFATRRNSSSLA
jgi:hypothetical protein